MNATTSAILWLSVQIAMFSLVGWLAFALLKRRGPNSATMCAAMVLALTLPLAAFVVSPWPRWISKSEIRNPKSETILKHETPKSQNTVADADVQRLPGDETDSTAADAALPPWWQPAVELFQPADSVAAKPVESHWHWQNWLPWVLAAGIGISSTRLAIGMWAVQKMKRQSQPVDDAALLDQVAILAAELGSPGVELRESKMLRSAVTIGWRRPLLLLPADWRTWSDTERRIVLAHELAHVLRRDFLTTLLARFAMAIHFYQPLVLWLGRQLRIQQELAADNCAAAVTGNRQTYLTTLAQMALRADEQPLPWAARAFLPGTSMLIKRVAWLKQKQTHVERSLGRVGRWTLAIGMVVIALAVAGIRGPSESGSQTVLAADDSTIKPQSASTDPKAAAQPLLRSFEFIPADAKFVAAMSPRELTKLPSVAKVLSQAFDPESERKHGIKYSDLADIQMVASSFNKPPERVVLRGAQPMDWQKILAKNFSSLEPRKAAGSGYYIVVKESDRTEGFGPCFFVPDDRTVVAGSEQDILNILKARIPGGPGGDKEKTMDPGLFPEFVNKTVAVYADISVIKSAIGSDGDPKNFEKNPMAAVLSPLFDHVVYARLGVEPKEKDSAETILTVKCDTPTGAAQVTGTLDAARVLVLNVLKSKKQAWDQAVAPPVPQEQIVTMKNLFDAAETVLSNIKMGSERNVATIWTTVDLDVFTKAGFVMPNIEKSREAARRMQSMNNMKQLALACMSYESATNHLPGYIMSNDGKPLLSWRVAILPYLGQVELYNQFRRDEPWDSEHNKALIAKMPVYFRDPHADEKTTSSSYFMPMGKGIIGDEGKGIQFKDIRDGTSKTILFVDAQRDIPWTKPEDIEIDIDPKKPLPAMGGNFEGIILAAFADGHVEAESQLADPKQLHALFTIAGAEPVSNPLEAAPGAAPAPAPTGAAPPVSAQSREAAMRESFNNLKNLALAIFNYEEKHHFLPLSATRDRNGKPLLSWRVTILPELNQAELYNQFHLDEPWDSEHNKALVEKMPAVFRDPHGDEKSTNSSYFMPTGKGMIGGDGNRVQIGQIKDGTSNTILLVDAKREIPWTKPEDIEIDLDPTKPLPPLGGNFEGIILAAFADGHVQAVSQSANPKALHAVFTINGGEVIDDNSLEENAAKRPQPTAPAQPAAPGKSANGSQPRFLSGRLMRIALQPQVQKELGIEFGNPQSVEISKLDADIVQDIQDRRSKMTEGELAGSQKFFSELRDKRDLELQKLLTPEQWSRLRQIGLQTTSTVQALLDTDVIKALDLTKDQQEKLATKEREHADEYNQYFNRLRQSNAENQDTKEVNKKTEEMNAEYEKKIGEILTKAQAEKFAELKGKPFDLSVGAVATRTRVSIPLGGLMGFALRAPILKELGIEKDAPQVAELRKLAEAYDQELRKLQGELAAEGRSPQQGIQYTAQAKLDPELRKVLTPEQDTRLRQIKWQQSGVYAFDNPELQKALGLQPDQQKKIEALVVEMMWKQAGILNPKENSPKLSKEEEQKKILATKADYEKKVNEVLSPVQQEQFIKLKGKPFDLSLLLPQTDGQPNMQSSAMPMSGDAKHRSTIEFHIAETEAGEGLTEAEEPGHPEKIYLHPQVELNNDDIAEVKAGTDSRGQAIVNIELTPEGAKKMSALTKNNLLKKLAIVIDGKVIMAARIQSEISSSMQITGSFSKEEAERIARGLTGK